MEGRPAFKSSEKIKQGDIIAVNGTPSNKLGFVYSIQRDAGSGNVTGFKILPVYVYDGIKKHPRDKNFRVLDMNDMAAAKLNDSKQYRMEFRIEDFPTHGESVPETLLRYGTANGTFFCDGVINKMTSILRKAAEVKAFEAQGGEATTHVFKLRADTPTHVRERRRAGKPLQPDITLVDAAKIDLLSETGLDMLTSFRVADSKGKQHPITMLHQAFDLASTDEGQFHSLSVAAAYASRRTLREAFADGYLNESASFNQLRDMGINRLGDASHMALRLSLWNPPQGYAHDKIDNDDIILQPIRTLRQELVAAWQDFLSRVAADKSQFETQGITCMYPR